MALHRNKTLTVGAVERFRVPRGCRVMVTAPDTMHLEIPAPNGVIDLWLPQAGQWLVEWPKGRVVLEVVEGAVTVRVDSAATREDVVDAIARSVKPRQYTGGA